MGGRGGSPSPSALGQAQVKAAKALDAETQIRQAYKQLAERPGAWVRLADLRQALSGLSRGQQDDALKSIALKHGVQVIPWDNRNALDAQDHAAALRLGGEQNHAIRIE